MINDIVLAWWPVFVAFVILIGWFIRLEAKVMYLEKDHDENKRLLWSKLDDMQKMLMLISQSISKLEGKIEK